MHTKSATISWQPSAEERAEHIVDLSLQIAELLDGQNEGDSLLSVLILAEYMAEDSLAKKPSPKLQALYRAIRDFRLTNNNFTAPTVT